MPQVASRSVSDVVLGEKIPDTIESSNRLEFLLGVDRNSARRTAFMILSLSTGEWISVAPSSLDFIHELLAKKVPHAIDHRSQKITLWTDSDFIPELFREFVGPGIDTDSLTVRDENCYEGDVLGEHGADVLT